MDKQIEGLGKLFKEIVDNSNEFGDSWKNLALAPEAFKLMKELPLRIKGELTPYTRIVLLEKMLSCVEERDCARFIMQVREYQASLFSLIEPQDLPEDMDIDGYEGPAEEFVREYTSEMLETYAQRTKDYLDPGIKMEEWCTKYDVHLKFDDVERTEKWEEVIYDVEAECAEELADFPKGMGYCHAYWSSKKAALARRGIEWRSPSSMNRGVLFD